MVRQGQSQAGMWTVRTRRLEDQAGTVRTGRRRVILTEAGIKGEGTHVLEGRAGRMTKLTYRVGPENKGSKCEWGHWRCHLEGEG